MFCYTARLRLWQRWHPMTSKEGYSVTANDTVICNRVQLGLGGGTLFQAANRSHIQSMMYMIETPKKKTVFIDSGNYKKEKDGMLLYELIQQRGGRVDAWIITHAHDDHYGGLWWILENIDHPNLEIGEIYLSFPPLQWLGERSERLRRETEQFLKRLQEFGVTPKPLVKGQILSVGGIDIEVLNDPQDYLDYIDVNDTSVAFLVHFPKRSILFLGDLAVAGGKKLLACCPPEKLRQDVVQMAHHGQNGVDKEFYTHIMPKVCLYCTPDWLWENDNGGGRDSGPWKTLETRRWMEELGAQVSCPHAYGDYLFY